MQDQTQITWWPQPASLTREVQTFYPRDDCSHSAAITILTWLYTALNFHLIFKPFAFLFLPHHSTPQSWSENEMMTYISCYSLAAMMHMHSFSAKERKRFRELYFLSACLCPFEMWMSANTMANACLCTMQNSYHSFARPQFRRQLASLYCTSCCHALSAQITKQTPLSTLYSPKCYAWYIFCFLTFCYEQI